MLDELREKKSEAIEFNLVSSDPLKQGYAVLMPAEKCVRLSRRESVFAC